MAMDVTVDRGRIQAELVRRGWTQGTLARLVGVSQPAICHALKGRTQSARLIARMARALGLPVEEIVRPRDAA